MEDLKFRAWDRCKEKMFDVVAINFELERAYSTWNVDGKNLYAPFSEIDLMQYTDRKDLMGNRICVGDIVETTLIRGMDEYILRIVHGTSPWEYINSEHVVVKGNVYENPELKERIGEISRGD